MPDLNLTQISGDEQSEAFLSMLNEDDVKSRLNLTSSVPVVAIKLENGSPPCAQVSIINLSHSISHIVRCKLK